MSGIFAVADPAERVPALDTLAGRMAAAMARRPWFVTEFAVLDRPRVALGRVGIGIFNHTPQPVWNEARTLAVVLAGEPCRRDDVSQRGSAARLLDERDLLALYSDCGDSIGRALTGAFILAVWDERHQRLVVVNDRHGLYPLYYSWRHGTLVCAPETHGVLLDPSLTRTIDHTALAQYVRFQHLLGTRTFFEGVTLLPHASVLCCDVAARTCTVQPYWSFDEVPYRPEIAFDDAVAELGHVLRQSVRRLSGDRYRPGVYLSGGLDSRTILGLIERRPVASLTFGTRHCRDVRYAARIAHAVGSTHYWCDLPDGRWVLDRVDFHLALTEGYHSWIHAHGVTTLPLARQVMDVNLTGWDGGLVMGHPRNMDPSKIEAVDDVALTTHLFGCFNQRMTWPSITESEEAVLYREPLRSELRGRAFESFRAELQPYLGYRPDVRADYFNMRNHCARFTFNTVTLLRSHVEVRFPFFDQTVFECVYSLPAWLRGDDRTLYRAVLQREVPRLAYVPYDADERLPTDRQWLRATHGATVRLRRAVNRYVWPLFPEGATLYADYETYLRTDLRAWAEGILFDRRTRDRGLFDPVALRSLMDRHLSGREQWTIGKIAPLITYELMLRRWYD